MASQIVDVAESLGYVATMEPGGEPFRLFGWFRERKFQPDIRVDNGNRSAIIVVKSRLVTVYDVFLTDKVRGKKGIGALKGPSPYDGRRGPARHVPRRLKRPTQAGLRPPGGRG